MRDWIVILLIALAGLGLGFWALRQRSAASADAAWASAGKVPPAAVPNTTVPPNPEDRLVATLEFYGPPETVPVKLGELVIGRHSSDDVRVPDVRVSRHHARFVARADGGFEIHNLTAVRSEPNPMLVNGASREHADIVDGDVVTLGGVSFRLRLVTA